MPQLKPIPQGKTCSSGNVWMLCVIDNNEIIYNPGKYENSVLQMSDITEFNIKGKHRYSPILGMQPISLSREEIPTVFPRNIRRATKLRAAVI